jgi:RNA polymerase sigma factor (sigma-70 family)
VVWDENPMSDDSSLLRRYVEERSEAAFAELVARHIGLVYGAALRQLNGAVHRAEDVTQSVFVDLARNAARLLQRRDLAGWLYTSTHFAAAKLKRGEQRRQVRETEAQLMHEISTHSSADPEWERLRPVLDEVMLTLEERDREAILLRFFQARRLAEVGQRLGLSEDAARMRIERALEKLRTLLARRGIGSTTAALSAALANQVAVAAPAGLAASVTSAAMIGGSIAANSIMSTPFVIASLVALGAMGFTVFQTRQVHRAEAELANAVRERDNFHAQIRTGQQQVEQAAQRIAALQQQIETTLALSATSGPTAIAATAAGRAAEERTELERAREEVEARRALRKSRSVVDVRLLDTVYRSLYRQLSFSADQSAQFMALARENAARHDEIDRLAAQQGVKVNDPAMQPLYAQADAEFHTKVAGAFGTASQQTVQHFMETLPVRPFAEQVARDLFNTQAPLTAPQVDRLVEIFSSNLRNAQGQLDATAMNADAIIAQSQTILTEAQMAPVRAVVAKFAAEAESVRQKRAAATGTPAH